MELAAIEVEQGRTTKSVSPGHTTLFLAPTRSDPANVGCEYETRLAISTHARPDAGRQSAQRSTSLQLAQLRPTEPPPPSAPAVDSTHKQAAARVKSEARWLVRVVR